MDRRTDQHTAAIIDVIVSNLPGKGMSHSARALYDVGAGLDLAKRVLTRPFERRPGSSNTVRGHQY